MGTGIGGAGVQRNSKGRPCGAWPTLNGVTGPSQDKGRTIKIRAKFCTEERMIKCANANRETTG